MTSFSHVLTEIFDRNVEHRFTSVEAEQAAIAEAKAGGEQATIDLMYAYTYALNNSLKKFRYSGGVNAQGSQYANNSSELHSMIIMGFMEAIHAFDPEKHTKLAALVTQYVNHELSTYMVNPIAFTVPQRTLTRFYSILRKAGGDPILGAKLAPENSMTVETFLDVLAAIKTADLNLSEDENGDNSMLAAWESAKPVWYREGETEDAALVMAAFGALHDDTEGQVIGLAYGFEDYEPVPDAEIGHRLGLSRPKVQRVRAAALGKMRDALGVA